MSADKYLSIFSRQMEAIVYILDFFTLLSPRSPSICTQIKMEGKPIVHNSLSLTCSTAAAETDLMLIFKINCIKIPFFFLNN